MDNFEDDLEARYGCYTYHGQSTSQCPCCEWPSAESSSSAYQRNWVNSYPLQAGSPNDLPDLHYDQNWPSPHSTTSSNVISTPPPDWQASWHPGEPQYTSNAASGHLYSPHEEFYLGTRQVARPTVPPIDTNCNSKVYVHDLVHESPIPNNRYECRLPPQSVHGYIKHHAQTSLTQSSNLSLGYSTSSASISSPNSPNISATASLPKCSVSPISCPPQSPLKIHQPRPFRRIPIISLSDLASASEGDPGSSKGARFEIIDAQPARNASKAYSVEPHSNPWTFHTSKNTSSALPYELSTTKVVACPCGCAESYIFH